MRRLTPDEFRKKYAELPPNLREAYGSVKTTEILEEIGKKHGLRIDQLGGLVDETGEVMLGITPPDEYVMQVEVAVGVSREKAKAIASDVNEQVFKPIRDALKRVHAAGGDHGIPPKEMAAPATADTALPITEGGAPHSEEKPASSSLQMMPPSLSEERLTKTFSLPHEEKNYTVSADGKELREEEDVYKIDPYREPVE